MARGASAPTEEGEGWGHIVAAARLQFVLISTLVTVFTVRVGEHNFNVIIIIIIIIIYQI